MLLSFPVKMETRGMSVLIKFTGSAIQVLYTSILVSIE